MATPSLTIEKFFARHAGFIAGAVVAMLTVCAIIFPRAIPFFYFSLALMAAVEIWRTGNTIHLSKTPSLILILSGLLTAWCFITILWSQAPMQALSKVLFLAAVIVSAWIISSWLASISASMSRKLKLGLYLGILSGASYLAIEAQLDQLIKITFLNALELQHSDHQKHYQVVNDTIIRMPLYLLNRNVATLNMLLWPAILMGGCLWQGKRYWLSLGTLVLVAGIATFSSEHEASMLAFLLSSLLFCLTWILPRTGLRLVTFGWIIAVLLVIPTTIGAYDHKLYKAEWLPYSARARIILWSHTAHEYLKNPVLGVGARTTQVVSDAIKTQVNKPEDHVLSPQTARHGHNIFLQAWYELGIVGALLFLMTGLAILSSINRFTDQIKPYAIATFGVAMVLAAFTWGMWQVWYIAMFALGMAALQIAAHSTSEQYDQ